MPNDKMFEDVPDDRWVFNAADYPHGTLALRADQGIDLGDLLIPGGDPAYGLFTMPRMISPVISPFLTGC